MKFSPASLRRLHWLNLPATVLITLFQRTPAVRVVATAADTVLSSPATSVLKAAVAGLGSFGALHSLAGATALSPSEPSPARAMAGMGTTLVFAVTGAPASPQSYTVGGSVPPGLTFRALGGGGAGVTSGIINASTIQLSGTPTAAGTFTMSIVGWRGANGTSNQYSASYTVVVSGPANTAPSITTQPLAGTVAVGSPAALIAAVAGTPTPTLQWFKNSAAIPGATTELLAFAAAALTDAGSYTLVATNSQGSVTSNAATLTVTGGVARPEVVAHPTSVARPLGAGAALAIVATGSPTYQWRKNGVAVAGATAATLPFAALAAADTASYDVVLTNAAGSITSDSATVVVAAPLTAVLRNLSVRTTLAANQILIVGVNMSGAGKEVLVRAVGPSLGVFGVPGTMADPRLAVFTTSPSPVQIAQNDNWGGNAAVAAANLRLGAFALTPNTSLDAALVTTIAGGRTVQVSGPTAGTVIVEAYDAGAGNAARFTSVAARNLVGTGGDVLIAGFTVDGTGSKNLLIRAAGPSLGALGVSGTLVDPKLEIFTATTVPVKVAENDNFSGAVDTLARTLGGFGFVPGARDAAILVSLPAGGYTVQVSGLNNGTGEAIIEVYEVP